MKFSCWVRCLSCGSDELTARSEPGHLECLSRSHAQCDRCGKVWRLTMSIVAVKKDRLGT